MSLELLTTAETLLAEAEEHYRTGSDTLERVLSSQRSLVQARREVLTSKLENARARLELTPVVVRD
jgi:outer membrane protein TolC